ncbi:hypothetical protein [Anaeromyxobacter oryzae]|uniref:Uncharacterized protein n=1 Tax=Anaeromyxobacter oryzae TaxID=2918170 RepID=A0ABN6MX33_9BACT|nr:hypothetical protein [Anaeromyxobacter oryzae]BDG05529.1 hypothetical protein AMOR_45250 [Anaeromyxobacter oryzae]
MAPAGLAAVALWVLAAAPRVELDAGIELRTESAGNTLGAPFEQQVVEARPSVALRLEGPRTRAAATYAPWFLLANPGAETGTMHRIDATVRQALSAAWNAELHGAAAGGVTPSWRSLLGGPLETAPTALLIRREQAQLDARVTGLLSPRASLSMDTRLLAGQGSAPTVRALRVGAGLEWLATPRDRLAGGGFGEVADASGRQSAAVAVLGGPARRLTPSAEGSVQVGVGALRDGAPGAPTTVLRTAPTASCAGTLRLLENRLTTDASLRFVPALSTWDGRASWRTELLATMHAVVSRTWAASVYANGARIEGPYQPLAHVGELIVSTTWAAPGGRAAVTGGILTRFQRGGGVPGVVETGALVSVSLLRIPVTEASPGGPR